MKTLLLVALFVYPSAFASELFQSESCKITAWVLVQKTKQKLNVTGQDQAYKLTFTDRALTYKMELVYSHQITTLNTEELSLTRVVSEAGEKDNEKILTQTVVTYSMPIAGGDMTTQKSSGTFRTTQKDPDTLLVQSLEKDAAKKAPDTLQTTKTTAPGVQTITSKSLGPNPAKDGIQILSTSDACSYSSANEDLMPGTDFYAAVPNAVEQFRAQFTATQAAEDAADSCQADGTDCAALAQAAAESIRARDDLWDKLFN